MKYIYFGKVVHRRGHTIILKQMSHVFDCPYCEYVMTALTEEGVVTLRDTHMRICHPERLVEMRMDDCFGVEPGKAPKKPVAKSRKRTANI